MGDRRMAEIKVSEGSIYFYTHWSGYKLPEAAQIALEAAKHRIGDDPYAMRIVLDALIRECGARDAETGAGIMLSPNAEDSYNGDEPSVIIDLIENCVKVVSG